MLERREITRETLAPILKLAVRPDQDHLVAPNSVTIAEDAYEEGTYVWGLWDGDTAVGLLALAHPLRAELEDGEDPEAVHMWRLMVAADQQGKGHGRAAIEEAVAQTRAWGFRKLGTSVVDAPDSNIGFYERLGFGRTGGYVDDEIALIRDV